MKGASNIQYPRHLELRQVQLFVRHGERTPTSVRFQSAGLPADWPYCRAAQQLTAVIRGANKWEKLGWQRRVEIVGSRDAPLLKPIATCLPNELTDRGRETTHSLGERLRQRYVTQLGFLSPRHEEATAHHVRLRSTPRERTVESTQHVFAGLYPSIFRSATFPEIVQRSIEEETLTPNESACKRLAELGQPLLSVQLPAGMDPRKFSISTKR